MKILTEHPTYEQAPALPKQSGIKRTQRGWTAIRAGRLVDEFAGTGSKARAIQAAGTNQVIV